jgi:hypothetical protein
MNPNPSKARQVRKKKKLATLKDVTFYVQKALETAHKLLKEEDTQTKLKACHAVFQGAQAFTKLYEVGELETRLKAVEEWQANQDTEANGEDEWEELETD